MHIKCCFTDWMIYGLNQGLKNWPKSMCLISSMDNPKYDPLKLRFDDSLTIIILSGSFWMKSSVTNENIREMQNRKILGG